MFSSRESLVAALSRDGWERYTHDIMRKQVSGAWLYGEIQKESFTWTLAVDYVSHAIDCDEVKLQARTA